MPFRREWICVKISDPIANHPKIMDAITKIGQMGVSSPDTEFIDIRPCLKEGSPRKTTFATVHQDMVRTTDPLRDAGITSVRGRRFRMAGSNRRDCRTRHHALQGLSRGIEAAARAITVASLIELSRALSSNL
jgi:hypothetical protein